MRSEEAEKYRRWYKTKNWRDLRAGQLGRQPLCRMCREFDGALKPATVVDHIRPHRGDRALFFCAANLQSLCAEHHDRDKQSEEVRGYSVRVGADGFPVDSRHPAQLQQPGQQETIP